VVAALRRESCEGEKGLETGFKNNYSLAKRAGRKARAQNGVGTRHCPPAVLRRTSLGGAKKYKSNREKGQQGKGVHKKFPVGRKATITGRSKRTREGTHSDLEAPGLGPRKKKAGLKNGLITPRPRRCGGPAYKHAVKIYQRGCSVDFCEVVLGVKPKGWAICHRRV